MLGITDNRLRHNLGVARECYNLALHKYNFSEEKARGMFVMGFLHDIGYEFADNRKNHPSVSYEIILQLDKDMLLAIKNHGNSTLDEFSIFDKVLNNADLTVNSKGDNCSVEDRLNDIKIRYGDNSKEYNSALDLADKLGLL